MRIASARAAVEKTKGSRPERKGEQLERALFRIALDEGSTATGLNAAMLRAGAAAVVASTQNERTRAGALRLLGRAEALAA